MPGAGTKAPDMNDSAVAKVGLKPLWRAYRLRWKRRYFLARAIRRRRQLQIVADRTGQIAPGMILGFATIRNEMLRLPQYLAHYRAQGVGHFLMVDNDSEDGSADYLAAQPDVSLWQTRASYKAARFGVDWLTWLQFRHGHGHWCLTADADELLCYPHDQHCDLRDLTEWLENAGLETLSAIMIELYPKGSIKDTPLDASNFLDHLCWFDGDNFWTEPRADGLGEVVRGGVRARAFFADDPRRAPTMNKIPLIKWNRRYAYLSSTHVALPPRLNARHWAGGDVPTAALLHTKFLADAPDRALSEKRRGEHFAVGETYHDYYDRVAAAPDLWTAGSARFESWRDLVRLGLVQAGGFPSKAKTDPKT